MSILDIVDTGMVDFVKKDMDVDYERMVDIGDMVDISINMDMVDININIHIVDI